MTDGAGLLMELYRRHMYAARSKKTQTRARLFNLIEEFEWAFPEIKAEIDKLYPQAEGPIGEDDD